MQCQRIIFFSTALSIKRRKVFMSIFSYTNKKNKTKKAKKKTQQIVGNTTNSSLLLIHYHHIVWVITLEHTTRFDVLPSVNSSPGAHTHKHTHNHIKYKSNLFVIKSLNSACMPSNDPFKYNSDLNFHLLNFAKPVNLPFLSFQFFG